MTGEFLQELLPEQAKSKLVRIKEQLSRPGIMVVGSFIETKDPPSRGIYQEHNIFIAPTTPIYTVPALTRFSYNLVDLQRTQAEGANAWGTGFHFPKVRFVETIGTLTTFDQTRKLVIPEEGLTREYQVGKAKISEVKRRIVLHVYPNKELAKLALWVAQMDFTDIADIEVKDDERPLRNLDRGIPVSFLRQMEAGEDPFAELRVKYPHYFEPVGKE